MLVRMFVLVASVAVLMSVSVAQIGLEAPIPQPEAAEVEASQAEVNAIRDLIRYECSARQWMMLSDDEERALHLIIDSIYDYPRPCVGVGA